MNSICKLILRISLGVMFFIGGLSALTGVTNVDFAYRAISGIFSGDVQKIVMIVFGIIEIITGILFILEVFFPATLAKISDLFRFIIFAVWTCAIIFGDFILPGGILKSGFSWNWFYGLASHFILVTAIFTVKK